MNRYSASDKTLNAIIKDLKSDFRGTVNFLIRYSFLSIRIILSSLYMWTYLRLINVPYGKSNIFIARSLVIRYPQSHITIGHNCSFNSARNVNLIGVNRKCIITTQTRGAVLQIGNYCGFSGTTIAAFKRIIIGDNVKVGANVIITDSDWHPEDKRAGNDRPVIIGDNVWIGVNAMVLKGVVIGENSVVGANSVVTKDIPPDCVAAGNPCSVIRKIIFE